jgi:hypothetical protein
LIAGGGPSFELDEKILLNVSPALGAKVPLIPTLPLPTIDLELFSAIDVAAMGLSYRVL